MINISDISKPSVSESPVKPRRAMADSEKVDATEAADAARAVAGKTHQSATDAQKDQSKPARSAKKQAKPAEADPLLEDDLYDGSGQQHGHSSIDLEA